MNAPRHVRVTRAVKTAWRGHHSHHSLHGKEGLEDIEELYSSPLAVINEFSGSIADKK
jgi:hypothetical protein